jgi:hypothetical protein
VCEAVRLYREIPSVPGDTETTARLKALLAASAARYPSGLNIQTGRGNWLFSENSRIPSAACILQVEALMDRIIKDRTGRPEGIIRQMAGGGEELLTNSGQPIAYYDPQTDATYKPGGYKIGSGNRLVGMVGQAD